jgi:hypothetical protein
LVGNTQRITHADSQLKRAERAIQAIRDQAGLPPEAADALQEVVDIERTIEDRVSTPEKAKVVLTQRAAYTNAKGSCCQSSGGLLYALRAALFRVILYRHGADFSTFVIHHRDLPFRVGWCFTRDQPCNGLRVGNGLLVITAIETGGIDKPVAVLHVEKMPRHIQDRLLFIAKGAAPALCLRRRGGTAQATRPGGRCGPITKASILK